MTTVNAGALSGADKFTMSVRALKSAQRVTTPDLCKALHMSRATFYERMNGNVEWSLNEALALSELFGAPLDAMMRGIGAKTESSPTPPYPRPYLAAKNVNPDSSRHPARSLQVVR